MLPGFGDRHDYHPEPTPSVSRHPLNRGCGESGFVTINPRDAGFVKLPAVNDTTS